MLLRQRRELIDYNEIIKLPYLEIKEGLHIFAGLKSFGKCFDIRTEGIKNYLQRDKIWWEDPLKRNINVTNQRKIFQKFYPLFLKKTNFLLEWGLHFSCYEIKTIIPIHNYIFPPLKLEDRILYLWKTEDLLFWAIGVGLVLPKELQIAFEINQFDCVSNMLGITDEEHLCNQGLAQLLWYLFPNSSYKDIKKEMKKVLGINLYQKTIVTPLDALIKKAKESYFNEEKSNTLDPLLSQIDPRIDTGKGRPKLTKPLPIKIHPEVIINNKIDFQKLKNLVLIIGAFLYRLNIIEDLESAMEHSIILAYLNGQNEQIKHFIKFWLLTILPTKELNEVRKKERAIKDNPIYSTTPFISDILERQSVYSFLSSPDKI